MHRARVAGHATAPAPEMIQGFGLLLFRQVSQRACPGWAKEQRLALSRFTEPALGVDLFRNRWVGDSQLSSCSLIAERRKVGSGLAGFRPEAWAVQFGVRNRDITVTRMWCPVGRRKGGSSSPGAGRTPIKSDRPLGGESVPGINSLNALHSSRQGSFRVLGPRISPVFRRIAWGQFPEENNPAKTSE